MLTGHPCSSSTPLGDDFAIFLGERTNMRVRQDVEHRLRRAAQLHAQGRHHDGPVDEDGVLHHEVDQLVIRPFGIAEVELGIGRALLAEKRGGPMPMLASNPTRVSREGGVTRYSMTSGSSPLWRIIANVLRDVPQAGLW